MNPHPQHEPTPTEARRRELYRDRWSTFGSRTGILELSEHLSAAELQRFEILAELDAPTLEKLSPDLAVARWQAGTTLFEAGTYLDLAFFIVAGSVEVLLDHADKSWDQVSREQPIFDLQRTSFIPTSGPNEPVEARPATDVRSGLRPLPTTLGPRPDPHAITFLATMDFDLPRGASLELGRGELFGEIGALSGWPQSVTARTLSETTLLQIRLPALRTLRRRLPRFKARLDELYRQRSLSHQLHATPLFSGLDRAVIETLKEQVELVSCEPDEIIAREGEPVDALYLVRSGFVKLAQNFASGTLVVNYLSKGMTLGEVELLVETAGGWTSTATSVEYAQLVKLPRARFEQFLAPFPEVRARLWQSAVDRIREAGFSRRQIAHSEFIQTALDTGLVQGNSMLVIDLNACTRCDDCVRACAATHDGRPRFLREGDKVGHLQIVHACYHCRDPVCLVGCPTGAIHRAGVGDVVAIDERICIGCQSCARSCPYDAIVMHQTETSWPADALPESLRGQPRLVASKCDLCYTDAHGPACVRNCPNGCAFRVGSLDEFKELLER